MPNDFKTWVQFKQVTVFLKYFDTTSGFNCLVIMGGLSMSMVTQLWSIMAIFDLFNVFRLSNGKVSRQSIAKATIGAAKKF